MRVSEPALEVAPVSLPLSSAGRIASVELVEVPLSEGFSPIFIGSDSVVSSTTPTPAIEDPREGIFLVSSQVSTALVPLNVEQPEGAL